MSDDLVQHAIDEGMPRRWPRHLARLCDVIYAALDISDDAARWEQTARLVVRIAQDIGGKELYLPRGDALKRAMRDARIFKLAERGWSCDAIGERVHLTARQVRTIVAAETKLRVARAQDQLFSESLPVQAA